MKIAGLFQEKKTVSILAAALLILVVTGVYFYLSSMPEEINLVILPVVREISNSQVRITWETEEAVTGSLYLIEGDNERVITEDGAGRHHEIVLKGLDPETVYSYRVSQGDRSPSSFKTPPVPGTAFRFLILHQEGFPDPARVDKFTEIVNTQLPDFAVVAVQTGADNYLERERAFFKSLAEKTPGLPVYLISGEGADFSFDYGNSRFIIPGAEIDGETVAFKKRKDWLEGVLSTPISLEHSFVLLTHYKLNQPGNNVKNLPAYLNDLLIDGKIEAVFKLDCNNAEQLLEGEKVFNIKENYMVVDVDGAGVTGQIGGYQSPEMTDVVIRNFPGAVKRSCVYCRKLIEKEKYEESIQWYRDFITDFGEEYMVDESQFEIANIYDRYLYDYENAVKEYNVLIDNYQNSHQIRQAKQRIEYLEDHSDYNFQPLRIFEKAKMETFEQDRRKAAAEIESILSQYPGSSLEPQLLGWLGRTLAEIDFARSVTYLERLAEEYGEGYREEALIALGDTLYTNMKYREAIAVYKRAETEANSSSLASKLFRCRRNITRERLKVLALIITGVLVGIAVFARPRLFRMNEIRLAGILALIYLTSGLVTWRLLYTDYPTLLQYILALSTAGAVVPVVVSAIFRKLFKERTVFAGRLLTGLITALLSLSVIYLAIYVYRAHYLVAFGL